MLLWWGCHTEGEGEAQHLLVGNILVVGSVEEAGPKRCVRTCESMWSTTTQSLTDLASCSPNNQDACGVADCTSPHTHNTQKYQGSRPCVHLLAFLPHPPYPLPR